jgi:hypothetical protein
VSFIGASGFRTTLRAAAAIACWIGLSASLTATPIIMGVTADGQLVQINPLTGAASGAVSLDGDYIPLGIAWDGSSLYLFGQSNGDLRQVTNLATGATTEVATPLASLPASSGFPGGAKGDLTYFDGNFFIASAALADGGYDANYGSFYSVADAPGYATAQVDSGTFPKVGGLAFGPGSVFYGLDSFGNTLFTLNFTTGTSTASTPVTGFDPSVDTVGGMVFGSDGTLYAVISADGVNSEWFSINPTTGAATFIGNIGGYDIVGLALVGNPVVSPVPEPDSFALCGTGALVLLVLLMRRLKS